MLILKFNIRRVVNKTSSTYDIHENVPGLPLGRAALLCLVSMEMSNFILYIYAVSILSIDDVYH